MTTTFTKSACPDCGTPLKLMYPCNDPEQGPREWLCPNGCIHGAACEYCDRFFHIEQIDGHDSFGNGIPEVDEENARLEAKFPELYDPSTDGEEDIRDATDDQPDTMRRLH